MKRREGKGRERKEKEEEWKVSLSCVCLEEKGRKRKGMSTFPPNSSAFEEIVTLIKIIHIIHLNSAPVLLCK